MNKSDFDQFCSAWGAASEVYNVTPTDGALALSFQALAKYSIQDIKKALMDYVTTSQFPPKPADIIKTLVKSDGRPEPDEAWSIAIESFDEYRTVILNDELSGALGAARDIYNDGDKVGARMAFRESYTKIIDKARRNGDPVKWWPSMGFDESGRKSALEQAVQKGLLQAAHVNHLLPSPITEEGQKVIGKAAKMLSD